jgi:tagatose-6-phosphate ketose/aldose isomerase
MNDQILGLSKEELLQLGASHTAQEIFGQPELWMKTWGMVSEQSVEINSFVKSLFEKDNLQVILTGAGTSAYIGEVLEGPFQKNTNQTTRAIPTTNLVTHPELYLFRDKPTLLISFARSGNSPESCKAVSLVKDYCNEIYNLIITCNPNGELAKDSDEKKDLVFVLPPEADDKSLAMTGSFSAMLLTGLLISRIGELPFLEEQKNKLFLYGRYFLETYLAKIKKIASLDFNRAIFLGSGLFSGIARESHLKLQELSDGKVICKHDSFLGFRHGPKAVIDDKTLITYLFSNNNYSLQYEVDLVKSVNSGRNSCHTVGVMEKEIEDVSLDTKIILSDRDDEIDEEFLTIVSVLFAQTLGFYKSIDLGLQPDSPSASGMIHRVVQGVKLYDYNGKVNVQKL